MMKYENLHTFKSFKKLKLNEEAGFFDFIGSIFKNLSGGISKLADLYIKNIKYQTDVDVIAKNTKKYYIDNFNMMKQELNSVSTDGDIKKLINDNLTVLYTTLSNLNINNVLKNKIKIEDIFKDTNVVKMFNVQTNKAIGQNGTISTYIKTILLPTLYKNTGLEYIKEGILFEADDLSKNVQNTDMGEQKLDKVDTDKVDTDKEKQPMKPIEKKDLVPGSVVTYKNKKGEIKKARINTKQDGVINGYISVDIVKESFVIPVNSITNVDLPDQEYKNKVKKLAQNTINWYSNIIITPLIKHIETMNRLYVKHD